MPPDVHPLQLISGPCSIEKVYPREWRIAIPASLLRVDDCFRFAVREFVNKSAASAASPDYAKFRSVIESAASAASLRGGRASGRLDHMFLLFAFSGRASGQNIVKISDSVQRQWTQDVG